MKFLSLLAATFAAVSAPVFAAHIPALNDGVILNYALTLEHLEATFYRHALAKVPAKNFTALVKSDAHFYTNLKKVAKDEADHVTFLTTALKAAKIAPVKECKYNFGVTTAAEYLQLASILEGVGVSAYLGAVASVADKGYLTAAGSIFSVEARHSAYLRSVQMQTPFALAFDIPLSFLQAWTLAAQFIVSCPEDQPKLPFYSYPTLGVSPVKKDSKVVKPGDTLLLTTTITAKKGEKLYAAFLTAAGPVFTDAKVVQGGFEATIPKDAQVAGLSYVLITCQKDAKRIMEPFSDLIRAGPGIYMVEKK